MPRAIAVYARTPRAHRARRTAARMPDDAAETARQLFAVLRDFDAAGVKLIWVETPPATAGLGRRARPAAARRGRLSRAFTPA